MVGALVAGVVAMLLTWLLHGIFWLATGDLQGWMPEHEPLPWWRLAVFPAVGALVCAALWWWIRSRGELTSIRGALADPERRFPLGRSLADAVVQVVNVGFGASIGREAAPRLAAAALMDSVSRRLGLAALDRRTVVAGASAAALAAIYNSPVAGAFYALEVLRIADFAGRRRRRVGAVVVGLGMCLVATVVAWPVIGRGAIFAFPGARAVSALLPLAVGAGLIGGLFGVGFHRMTRWAGSVQSWTGWRLVASMAAVGLLTGAMAVMFPSVTGNGQGVVRLAIAGSAPLWAFLVLSVLKPVLTSLTLAGGSVGGQLQPSMATGAALGAGASLVLVSAGVDVPLWQLALVTGVAVLAANQKAPLFSCFFGLELTHPHPTLALPVAVAALLGWLVREGFERRRRTTPNTEPRSRQQRPERQ